jgi:hypothetical protein
VTTTPARRLEQISSMTWRNTGSSNTVHHVRPGIGSDRATRTFTCCSPKVSTSALTPLQRQNSNLAKYLVGLFVLDSCQLFPALAIPPIPVPRAASANAQTFSIRESAHLFRLLQELHYRSRGRDGKCLITDPQTQTYSRLKVAHIFPRVHDVEASRLYLSHTHNTVTADSQGLPEQDHPHGR